MSDLISRRAAIDAVEHITSSMSVCVNTDECHGMKRMQRQAVIELANLPSAQQIRTQMSSANDLISRQAAIDLIENESRKWGDEYGVSDVLCDLSDMPSAQSERPKGEWMVSHIPDSMLWECNQCGFDCGAHSFNFCPNCGADMRGEQNE